MPIHIILFKSVYHLSLPWVMRKRLTQTLKIRSSYANICGDKNRWKIIPACLWRSVWQERNLRCFQNKSNTIQKSKMNCLVLLQLWCKQEYMEDLELVTKVLGSLHFFATGLKIFMYTLYFFATRLKIFMYTLALVIRNL